MQTNYYPYSNRDLLKLLFETPGVTILNNFRNTYDGYCEIKINNKFLYITFTETGLYIIIEAPERRIIASKSIYIEDHYNFQATDKIWLKDSLNSENLGNQTHILNLINNPDFKAKYGFSQYTLRLRLLIP